MEIILKYKDENKAEIEGKLSEDPFGRQSFEFKEPKLLGFEEDEGTSYLYFKTGEEEIVKQLKEALGDLAEETDNQEAVLAKIAEETEAANAGMGAIFD